MPAEIYGPLPDSVATDQELEAAIDVVELQITNVNNTLDARLDILEAGTSAGVYMHVQDSPTEIWTIMHNLGYYANVTVVDSLNREVEGDITYLNTDTIEIVFSAAFSGKAYLS